MNDKAPTTSACIRHTHADMTRTSWCGRQIGTFEWVFVSVDHALYNQMNQGRIMPCDACMAAIIEVLGER